MVAQIEHTASMPVRSNMRYKAGDTVWVNFTASSTYIGPAKITDVLEGNPYDYEVRLPIDFFYVDDRDGWCIKEEEVVCVVSQ